MTTTMTSELVRLRRELARHDRGPGRRYPAELRAEVTAWAREQLSAGTSVRQVAVDLGARFETIRRWLAGVDDGSRAPRARLLPVRVVDDATGRTVSVISPTGFRVEGLSLVEAVAMLRALG
jgi:hypothetical protein